MQEGLGNQRFQLGQERRSVLVRSRRRRGSHRRIIRVTPRYLLNEPSSSPPLTFAQKHRKPPNICIRSVRRWIRNRNLHRLPRLRQLRRIRKCRPLLFDRSVEFSQAFCLSCTWSCHKTLTLRLRSSSPVYPNNRCKKNENPTNNPNSMRGHKVFPSVDSPDYPQLLAGDTTYLSPKETAG